MPRAESRRIHDTAPEIFNRLIRISILIQRIDRYQAWALVESTFETSRRNFEGIWKPQNVQRTCKARISGRYLAAGAGGEVEDLVVEKRRPIARSNRFSGSPAMALTAWSLYQITAFEFSMSDPLLTSSLPSKNPPKIHKTLDGLKPWDARGSILAPAQEAFLLAPSIHALPPISVSSAVPLVTRAPVSTVEPISTCPCNCSLLSSGCSCFTELRFSGTESIFLRDF